jgi:hypothetical protein
MSRTAESPASGTTSSLADEYEYEYEYEFRHQGIDGIQQEDLPRPETGLPADVLEDLMRRFAEMVESDDDTTSESSINPYAYSPSDCDYTEFALLARAELQTKKASPNSRTSSSYSRTSSSTSQCSIAGDEMIQKFDQVLTAAWSWIGAI